eukprot:5553487-Pyramimonas_sp.AAC.1
MRHLHSGCLGSGARSAPLLVFGGASGSAESRDGRLRRVGLGLVVIDLFSLVSLGQYMLGPLWGSQSKQTVPRGELVCLSTAIEYSTGVLVYVADNDEVCRGWWQA